MRRRAFIAGLLTWEIAKARAQAPGRIYRLGVLGPGDASSWLVSPMRTITLAKLAEDHNLQVQVHFGSGESLPELAQELVNERVGRPAVWGRGGPGEVPGGGGPCRIPDLLPGLERAHRGFR